MKKYSQGVSDWVYAQLVPFVSPKKYWLEIYSKQSDANIFLSFIGASIVASAASSFFETYKSMSFFSPIFAFIQAVVSTVLILVLSKLFFAPKKLPSELFKGVIALLTFKSYVAIVSTVLRHLLPESIRFNVPFLEWGLDLILVWGFLRHFIGLPRAKVITIMVLITLLVGSFLFGGIYLLVHKFFDPVAP